MCHRLGFRLLASIGSACALIGGTYAGEQQPHALKERAIAYLQENEPRFPKARHEHQQLEVLLLITPAAFFAENLDSAERYSRQLIDVGVKELAFGSAFGQRAHGNAEHVGHLVLGLVALRRQNVESAKDHLLAACRVPGSPAPNTYGPDMTLAKELLDRGEQSIVIEYIDLCSQSNSRLAEQFRAWKSNIAAGKAPDFGWSVGTQLTIFARIDP